MKPIFISLLVLVTWTAAIVITEANISKIEAKLTRIQLDNSTTDVSGFFECTVHKDQSYFLDHVMSWSHVGRDGKEHYISMNWELVNSASYPMYSTSSKTIGSNGPNIFYFVLKKEVLTPDDNGEYVCHLFDYSRNLLQEKRLSVIVFEDGLAMSPYIVKETSGTDVAINCMVNMTDANTLNNTHVMISHVLSTGEVKVIYMNDSLMDSNQTKYSLFTNVTEDGVQHYVVTIKGLTQTDDGQFVCGIHDSSNHTVLRQTKISIFVDEPTLTIKPHYFLNAPTDSRATFRCACDPGKVGLCTSGTLDWSFENKYTSLQTAITQNGTLVADAALYEVTSQEQGAVNLTIKGVVESQTEGEYICHTGYSNNSVYADARIPVTVTPVTIGALALTDNYPARTRLLCTLTGTQWDNKYLHTHTMLWQRTHNGTVTSPLSSNGKLDPASNSNKYSLFFDPIRDFSILDIKGLTAADHGDYSCILVNKETGTIIRQETLSMYGKGNSTLFSGSYFA